MYASSYADVHGVDGPYHTSVSNAVLLIENTEDVPSRHIRVVYDGVLVLVNTERVPTAFHHDSTSAVASKMIVHIVPKMTAQTVRRLIPGPCSYAYNYRVYISMKISRSSSWTHDRRSESSPRESVCPQPVNGGGSAWYERVVL